MNRRHFLIRAAGAATGAAVGVDLRAADDAPAPHRQGGQDRRRMAEGAHARRSSTSCARKAPSGRSSSPLNNEKRKGTFVCAGCDLPLFESSTKYDSGTGWPSFWQAIAGAVEHQDRPQAHLSAHRVPLRALRRPSGPRVRRRPEADGVALLQQRRGAEVRPGVTSPVESGVTQRTRVRSTRHRILRPYPGRATAMRGYTYAARRCPAAPWRARASWR